MSQVQPGILEPVPPLARYLAFSLGEAGDARGCLRALREIADGRQTVVGFGESLTRALDAQIPGLRTPPGIAGRGFEVPSTPFALWCWLRGTDRGELLHRSRRIGAALSPAFRLEHMLDAFRHEGGRDLTGYEDGTENPKGEDAIAAAVVRGQGEGMDGSSFVAVQQWLHEFERFVAMPGTDQDNAIGRRRSDNEELADAPASAHVKRTAQESFTPEAFVLRRSMPWAEGRNAGLHFVAFGRSFDAFEAQLNRMVGAEDGIADALFAFTRPVSSAYFWCPPLRENRLHLRALGV